MAIDVNGGINGIAIGDGITVQEASCSNFIIVGEGITINDTTQSAVLGRTVTSSNATGFKAIIGTSITSTQTRECILGYGVDTTVFDGTLSNGGSGSAGNSNGELVAIGYLAKAGSWRATAVGGYAEALPTSSTAIGHHSYAEKVHGCAIGRGASAFDYTDAPEVVFYEREMILGNGVARGTNPTISETTDNVTDLNAGTFECVIHGVSGLDYDGSGNTSVRGGHIVLSGGRSTGTADGGEVRFKTTPAGGSDNNTMNAQVVAGQFDAATSVDTRFLLLDVTDSTIKRVEFGADDSAGSGYKYLRVAN